MAGRINAEDIRALREQADLASVASDYTALRRAGGTLKGLCPFHGERTPSFTVDPAKGVWHCFGCGEGGDVFGLLMQAEALSFPEAVEHLARREGYPLRYEELSPGQRRAIGRRTRLAQVTAAAAAWFRAQLAGQDGADARAYLARRGLEEATLERFAVGWAPDAWDALTRHLREEGFTGQDLVDAGLATEGRRGPMDRFRGRVIFPIHERSGRDVVAFGGRVLPDRELRTGPRDGEPPKYLNSPETELYRKSEVLYGLAQARAEIQRRQTAVLVEGYTDVLALHQAGVGHAVATCGTALTAEHLRQLERYGRTVVLALDADEAGYRAADRARQLAADVGIRELRVLPLPPGTDPADLAAQGPEAVERALAAARTATEFQIEQVLRTASVDTPEAQAEAYRATFPLLARLRDRAVRYGYIRDAVAPRVRLPADRIEGELDRALAAGEVSPDDPVAVGEHAGAGQRAAPSPDRQSSQTRLAGRPAEPRDPQLRRERDVLQLALQQPHLLPEAWTKVTEDDFTAEVSRRLLRAVRAAASTRLDDVLAALADDDERARVRALALSEPKITEERKAAEEVAWLRAATLEREIAALTERLRSLHPEADRDEADRLFARRSELERARRQLTDPHGG